MAEPMRKFKLCSDPTCTASGEHFHEGAWEAFKASLTEEQMRSLKDKARWEHMSVSAVAAGWGVADA